MTWPGGSVRRPGFAVLVGGSVLAALGLIGILAASARGDGGSQTEPDAVEATGGATLQPLGTPDTSKDFWYVPYLEQDSRLPRYERTVAGITLGPQTVDGRECRVDFGKEPPPSGHPVAVEPRYLPQGAIVSGFDEYGLCDGEPASMGRAYYIAPEGDINKLKSGELSFFDMQHGGAIDIFRIRMRTPAFQSTFASDRFEAGTVKGRPAAIGPPIFEAGFGESEIYIWDAGTRVLTVVRGGDLSRAEMLRIAEGLFD